ncbi:scavenger receptor cysteine-rich domain-containing group B protein-like [Diadema antillarum]|uniref:scavenger receptor cysteine-rich domain-containing group B protein-like n=2 Tax=Diadema antillarum TaxID=105358 RepID=UPI003A8A64C6
MLALLLLCLAWLPLNTGQSTPLPASVTLTTTVASSSSSSAAIDASSSPHLRTVASDVSTTLGTTERAPAIREYQLRLVGLNVTHEGLLQVYMNGVWGWVFGPTDSYRGTVAKVVCKQMGYEGSSNIRVSVDESVELATDTLQMSQVNCSGDEFRLVDCGHVSHTDTQIVRGAKAHYIAMGCDDKPLSRPIIQVSLSDGNTTSGWLQVEHVTYGRVDVCSYTQDISMAHVICRQLGLTYALGWMEPPTITAIPQKTQYVLYSADCFGHEHSLADCDVKIRQARACQDSGVGLRLSCSTEPSVPFGSRIRLSYDGHLQVLYNSMWNFYPAESVSESSPSFDVICRQLGGLNVARANVVVVDSVPVAPYVSRCRGSESSLEECQHVANSQPRSQQRVLYIICSMDTTPKEGSLRLVNGQIPSEGRVEIYIGYEWGTICDDYWNDAAAKVACRQLGLGLHGSAIGNAYFGRGPDPIMLDDVTCVGNEESILQCGHRTPREHNCQHSEDAGVRCTQTGLTEPPSAEWSVELVGSSAPQSGTIIVYIDGRHGTICDDYFDINDGLVVCHMLGYPYVAEVHGSAHFGIGYGEILLDDLKCSGTETNLAMCAHSGVGLHNCGHHEDAAVTCSDDPIPIDTYPDPGSMPYPTYPADPPPPPLSMGIGSAGILIGLLVVMCVGCMFCACIMRRMRGSSSLENNNREVANTYIPVEQQETSARSATSVPPSYIDVLSHPDEYTQVNDEPDAAAVPPQSPPPTSPPPSYSCTFSAAENTLRVVTMPGSESEGEAEVHRETIPIPLSPPPSYDDAALIFPSARGDGTAPALPDVVAQSNQADERTALQEDTQEGYQETVT